MASALGFEFRNLSTARTRGKQLDLVRQYVLEHPPPGLRNVSNVRVFDATDDAESGFGRLKHTAAVPDLGTYSFAWLNETLYAHLHEIREGRDDPIKIECIILAQGVGRGALLQDFLEELIREDKAKRQQTYKVHRFTVAGSSLLGSIADEWAAVADVPARALDSVVLPAKLKAELTEDLDRFLDSGTRKFFNKHGVPYRRGYLFYGPPGSGKTSLIQALAGKYERNLCILQPSGQHWGDREIQNAVDRVPKKSFVVLEDVDALFDAHRSNTAGSRVTFSGFLKAMEMSMTESDLIFILTTNHRERLDEALLRPGRMDKHIEFKPIQPAEIEEMFRTFFPDDAALAPSFLKSLNIVLDDDLRSTLSAAQVQHYFINMRDRKAEEVLQEVTMLRRDAMDRSVSSDPFGFGDTQQDGDEEERIQEQLSGLLSATAQLMSEVDDLSNRQS